MLSCLWDVAYKEPLLLIEKSSPCGSSGFSLVYFAVSYMYSYSNNNSITIRIIICFIKSKYKGDNSIKNRKGVSALKSSS